jgi:transcriptional regulator with XRE-family HTH domain
VNGKQLRTIRDALGLTQAGFAERLRITRNSVARMERGEMIVTPPMELLISYVAREAGVDSAHGQTSRGAAAGKKAHRGKARDSVRASGRRQRS